MELSHLSDVELRNMNRLVLAEFKRRETIKGTSFSIGDHVQWFSSKRGVRVRGFILKCNQKSATIQQEDAKTKWNVSWSLITAIVKETSSATASK